MPLPRLPDLSLDTWIRDQQQQFERTISSLAESLEFKDAVSDIESTVPADFPYPGGEDQWGQAAQQEREAELRRQQEEDERRKAQIKAEEDARQYEAYLNEKMRLDQEEQQAQQDALMQSQQAGIASPDQALAEFQSIQPGSQPVQDFQNFASQIEQGQVPDGLGQQPAPLEPTPPMGVPSAVAPARRGVPSPYSLAPPAPEPPPAPDESVPPPVERRGVPSPYSLSPDPTAEPPPSRPYWQPTETEQAGMAAPAGADWLPAPIRQAIGTTHEAVRRGAAAEPIEAESIPTPLGSVPLSPTVRQALGSLEAANEPLSAAGDYLYSRGAHPLAVMTPDFARQGILKEHLSPEEWERYSALSNAIDTGVSLKGGVQLVQATPEGREEYRRYREYADREYQKIKDDPDELMRYYHAAPGSEIIPGAASMLLGAGLGGAAKTVTTGTARALGASPRAVRAAGYLGDIAGQTVVDPTTPAFQPAADLALKGIGAGVRGARSLAGRAGQALIESAEEAPRVAGERRLGSGVLNQIEMEENPALRETLRPRVIPPNVGGALDYFPLNPPTDPGIVAAIRSAGGTVDEQGVLANVIRYEDAVAHGGTPTRGAPFFLMAEPGSESLYAGKNAGVGGAERIEGKTRFRNPLFITQGGDEGGYFDDALKKLGVQGQPDPERVARLENTVRTYEEVIQQAVRQNMGEHARITLERQLALYRDELAEAQFRGPVGGRREIDDAIDDLRSRTEEHSPERIAGLQKITQRYGGDPSVVPELVALRPNENESGYAIVENIIAENARKQRHDAVIYLRSRGSSAADVMQHPDVVAANKVRIQSQKVHRAAGEDMEDAHHTALGEFGQRAGESADEYAARIDQVRHSPRYEIAQQRAYVDPAFVAARKAYEQAQAASNDARQAWIAAREKAQREAPRRYEVSELMDPRLGRNPTPGIERPFEKDHELNRLSDAIEGTQDDLRAAQAARSEALREWSTANPGASQASFYATPEGQEALRQVAWFTKEAEDLQQRFDLLVESTEFSGPPGYTLREDIPAPEGVRRSTIVENPQRAAIEREYEEALAAYEQLRYLDPQTTTAAEMHARAQSSEVRDAYERLLNAQVERNMVESGSAASKYVTDPEWLGSGVVQGLRRPAYNFAQGGVLGAASEDAEAAAEGRDPDMTERLRRVVGMGALAAVGGSRTARRTLGRGLMAVGSGVTPTPHTFPKPSAAAHRLFARITDDSPEGIKWLWDEDPQDAIAVNLNLNNAPSMNTIEQARGVAYREAQDDLAKQGIPETVTVYRGGGASGREYETVTLDRSVAEYFGRKSGVIESFEVPRDRILAALDTRGRGTFAEGELLVPASDLRSAGGVQQLGSGVVPEDDLEQGFLPGMAPPKPRPPSEAQRAAAATDEMIEAERAQYQDERSPFKLDEIWEQAAKMRRTTSAKLRQALEDAQNMRGDEAATTGTAIRQEAAALAEQTRLSTEDRMLAMKNRDDWLRSKGVDPSDMQARREAMERGGSESDTPQQLAAGKAEVEELTEDLNAALEVEAASIIDFESWQKGDLKRGSSAALELRSRQKPVIARRAYRQLQRNRAFFASLEKTAADILAKGENMTEDDWSKLRGIQKKLGEQAGSGELLDEVTGRKVRDIEREGIEGVRKARNAAGRPLKEPPPETLAEQYGRLVRRRDELRNAGEHEAAQAVQRQLTDTLDEIKVHADERAMDILGRELKEPLSPEEGMAAIQKAIGDKVVTRENRQALLNEEMREGPGGRIASRQQWKDALALKRAFENRLNKVLMSEQNQAARMEVRTQMSKVRYLMGRAVADPDFAPIQQEFRDQLDILRAQQGAGKTTGATMAQLFEDRFADQLAERRFTLAARAEQGVANKIGRYEDDVAERGFTQQARDEVGMLQAQIRGIRLQLDEAIKNKDVPGASARIQELLQDMRDVGKVGQDAADQNQERLLRQNLADVADPTGDAQKGRLRDALATLDWNDPASLRGIMDAMRNPTKWDRFREGSYISMLSNPWTTLTNLSSNVVTAAGHLALQNPLERLYGGARAGGTRAAAEEFWRARGEGGQRAWDILKTGQSKGNLERLATGDMGGLRREYLTEQGGVKGKLAEWYHRFSTRPLEAADQGLGYMVYQAEVGKLAQREADRLLKVNDVRVSGMSPEEARHTIMTEIWDYPEIMNKAREIRDQTLLRERGNDWWEVTLRRMAAARDPGLKPGMKDYGRAMAMDFVLPFFNVPLNYARQGAQRSFGSPYYFYQGGKKMLAGDVAGGAENLAKGTISAAAMGTAASLFYADALTGAGPEDPGDRANWLQTHQPYSVRIPGTDTWHSYAGSPVAIPFAVVAGAGEGWSKPGKPPLSGGEERMTQLGGAAFGGFSGAIRGIGSQSFLQGLSQSLELVSNPDFSMGNAAQLGATLATRYASAGGVTAGAPMLSGMSGFLASMTDRMERDAGRPREFSDLPQNVGARIATRIPGARYNLDPRIDAYGQPVANKRSLQESYGVGAVDPYYRGPAPRPGDRISQNLGTLGIGRPPAPDKITVKGVEFPLTIHEQREFDKNYGQAYRQILDAVERSRVNAEAKTGKRPVFDEKAYLKMRDKAHDMAVAKTMQAMPRDLLLQRVRADVARKQKAPRV